MSTRASTVWVCFALAACGGGAGVDGGSDAAPVDLGADATPDLGADAELPDLGDHGPADLGADARPDLGPDTDPLGCSTPGTAMVVSMPAAGVEWTATLDASMRLDHHLTTCAPWAVAPDVVLALDLPSAGRLVVETTDASLDTVLSVRTSCEDVTTELACNDDAGVLGGPSRVAIDVSGGRVYVIVDARSTAAPIRIRAVLLPSRAAGDGCDPLGAADACASGTECLGATGAATCVATSAIDCAGGTMELEPFLVGRSLHVHGTLAGHPDVAASASCAGSAPSRPDAIHHLTVPFRARVDIASATSHGAVVFLRSTCDDATSELACGAFGFVPATVPPILEAGTDLFVFVEDSLGMPGDYDLWLDLAAIVDAGHDCVLDGLVADLCDPVLVCRDEGGASRVCRAIVCGDGYAEGTEQCDPPDTVAACAADCTWSDACDAPIDMAAVGTVDASGWLVVRATNRGALDRAHAGCVGAAVMGGRERYYAYTAAADGMLTLTTDDPGTTFDTVLYARDGCTTTDLACNDDGRTATPRTSTIRFAVTAGQTVVVVVDGYNALAGSVGDFVLRAQVI